MSEIEYDPSAVREYERTLVEVAEQLAVDEAEETVALAWIYELDEMRREGLRLALTARIAERTARETLRAAQVAGRPGEIIRAHNRFAQVEAETVDGLDHADALLATVDAALDAVCRAALDRGRRNEQAQLRLHAAWAAAYGPHD